MDEAAGVVTEPASAGPEPIAETAHARFARLQTRPWLARRDVRAKRPPALSFLLRMETLRRVMRVVVLLALDFVGLFAGIFTALAVKGIVYDLYDVSGWFDHSRSVVAFGYLVMVLLFAGSGLYADRGERPGLPRIIGSLFQVTVVAIIFAFVNGERYSSYYIFYGSMVFAMIWVSSLRQVFELVSAATMKAAGYRRRAVVVGSGGHIEAVAHALADGPHAPVNVVGYISLAPRPENDLPSLGSLEELGPVIEEHDIDEVIIADPDFPQRQAVQLVDECHQRGVRVRIAPSTMEILVRRAEFVPGQSVPLFELKPPVFEGIDYAIKRTFDVVVSVLLVVFLSPLLLAIYVAVRLSSRGPAVYRSIRPGIGGEPFACLKFRTMLNDADERQADLESMNEASGPLFKIRRDPRTTRVGRFLRHYSLDELPQLWNVLRGEMSLVGPRPLPQRDFERLEDWHLKRYHVLPGMTGLWQVSGRSELDFDDLVRLDFLYLERWSVFLDMTIIVKTLPAVLLRRGAY